MLGRTLLALAVGTFPLVAAPVPKAAPKRGLIAGLERDRNGTRVIVLKRDGTEVANIDAFGTEVHVDRCRLSNDGKRVAACVSGISKVDGGPNDAVEIRVYDLAKPDTPLAVATAPRIVSLGFGADADTLYVGQTELNGGVGKASYRVSRIDVTTGKTERLDKLDGHLLFDVSADGKSMLVNRIGVAGESYVVDAETLKMTRATKEMVALHRLSPDGTKAVGIQYVGEAGKYQGVPVVVDLKTGDATLVKDDDGSQFQQFHWSADGTKLLAHRGNTKGEGGYVLCDPDGSNSKPFLDGKRSGLKPFDWR